MVYGVWQHCWKIGCHSRQSRGNDSEHCQKYTTVSITRGLPYRHYKDLHIGERYVGVLGAFVAFSVGRRPSARR